MLSFVSVLGQLGKGRQTQLEKGQGLSVQGVRGSPPSCPTCPGGGGSEKCPERWAQFFAAFWLHHGTDFFPSFPAGIPSLLSIYSTLTLTHLTLDPSH